jgi:hypothetical protein
MIRELTRFHAIVGDAPLDASLHTNDGVLCARPKLDCLIGQNRALLAEKTLCRFDLWRAGSLKVESCRSRSRVFSEPDSAPSSCKGGH